MALDNGNASLKYAAWLSSILLSILLIGSIMFCRERMLFIDAPHILFRIINERHFWIEQHRYGSFISQLLPLIGAHLHLPLQWLMLLYSVGFYLFYLVVCLLLVRMRQYGLAVLMGLYFTLMVSATYYWPNNEVHQGIAWLLLAFGLHACMATGIRNTYLRIFLFTAIFFLAIWTHPLVIPAALYLWVFFLAGSFDVAQDDRRSFWLYSGILLLLCAAKVYTGMHDWYDSSKIDLVTHVDYNKIKGLLHAPQLHYFIYNCLHHYSLFSLLTIVGLLALLFQRKYILFMVTVFTICGYVALVCITFWEEAPRWYIESEYMPLVLIGCAPFVYYLLPKIKPTYAMLLLAAVYILRLACIYLAAAPFVYRNYFMERMNVMMYNKEFTKVIITDLPVNGKMPLHDYGLLSTWGAPVESLFISALNGEHPQRTFIFMKSEEIKATDTTARNIFLGCFERRNVAQINTHYFELDTTSTYKVMSYGELMGQ